MCTAHSSPTIKASAQSASLNNEVRNRALSKLDVNVVFGRVD